MKSQLVLGFMEATNSEVFGEGNYKLVPWISWDDWNLVREYLFSSSPGSIDLALRRISAWRSRGCVPVIIEVTASIVETQQKDSYFRDGLSGSDLLAEDMLTLLYCMSIMRLVNGIVEKTRKKNEISIGEAADVIGIPRMLIDIRHECSHRDLPSLKLVRLASTKALDWLKAYYWEPQKMAIPYPGDRTTIYGKEIKSKIRELAFSLNVKQATPSDTVVVKKKRKFLFTTCEDNCTYFEGSKKKALKNVLKLYSSSPSEVVSILLEFLLKAQESADMAKSSQASESGLYNTQLDDWKPLIMKLSNKDPDILLSLLKAVVHMIETGQALKHESGEQLKPEHKVEFNRTEHLSYLFKWLVGNLTDLKPSRRKNITTEIVKEKSLPKSTLIHLLRKCLMVSPSLGNNNHLASAALVLAQTADHPLVQKLKKLASLHKSNTDSVNETAHIDPESFYNQEEMFIKQEAKKLELLKQKLSQKRNPSETAIEETEKRWRVVKSWKPCPIGMLPCDVGSSGVIPVLDTVNNEEEEKDEEEEEQEEEERKSCGKREADCPLMVLDDSEVKKVKCCEEEDGLVSEGVRIYRLMIGGMWKSVSEDEVMNMASAVKILV
ncbi:hypothetical protein SSX86_002249 [Deinandra increscens subsp. villosa]|uniref:Las1-like protein n=1 Tax=Deinandra increscens subsp. villosa TaxID=3103831 RepID=A0AAP0HB34_9ASTR